MSDETTTPWTVRNCGNEAHGPTWECHRVEDASGIVLLRNVTRDVAEQYASLPLLEQQLASERAAREKAERERDEAREEVETTREDLRAMRYERDQEAAHREQAERDEARHDRETLESNFSGLNSAEVLSQLREHEAARERAEADNAARLEALRLLTPDHDDGWRRQAHEEGCPWLLDETEDCSCDGAYILEQVDAARSSAHPGAALLEERAKLREHEAEMAESLRNALERLRALEEVREACESSRRGIAADVANGGEGVSLAERALLAACAKADALRGKA